MPKLSEEDKILRKRIILRIIELRGTKIDKQVDFAHELGLDKQQINSWESLSNNRGISIYSINKICKGLNKTLKEFFDSPIFDDESKC